MIIARINVWLACLLWNFGGKRKDVSGRTYRQAYCKFGNKTMANDFLCGNSWYVKKRIGLM